MPVITKKEFRHFVQDRLSVILLLTSGVLAIINTLIVLLQVRSSDLQIPVRYTEYSSNFDRGSWTILYELALFAVLVFCINGILAMKIRPLRRLYAIGILVLTLLVMVISLLVTNSLVGLIVS